jgi:hypothetical protein
VGAFTISNGDITDNSIFAAKMPESKSHPVFAPPAYRASALNFRPIPLTRP